ncbi:MAG: transposase [Dokdonella sp.]|nr:transposase [Dokdonella sp.]
MVLIGSLLDRDARDGGAYVFRNRTDKRIKVLCMDGQGVWLCVRRLHEGSSHFRQSVGGGHKNATV